LMYQPTGKVTIRLHQANLTFKSNVCEWLLTQNKTATLTGTGKINNQGDYGYLLIANDHTDKLRIIIWDKNEGDRIVYDNLTLQNIQGAIVMFNRVVLTKEGEEDLLITPVEFALDQNYPNPFNPATKISYSIPEAGNVELKVYDLLGNEVVTLVNEEKSPGKYIAEFNASTLASGVYMYTLRTNNFIQSKKMVLMK